MLHQIALLAVVTILGVLQQAYFVMQVISVRRKCKVSPPVTSGPPEFERVFRAQVNCAENFPTFLSLLWVAGIFSHQVLAAFFGLIYLCARCQYFSGYARSAEARLGPLYISAGVLCILIGLSVVGLMAHFVSL
uniref:Leukotriene C4 synthase n=1 Tax=Salvator merianae TaxID=96440 RepID=A0A8D0DUV4_SALMN